MDATGKRFAVVVARWNEMVTKELREGALDELRRHGATDIELVDVPGSWEIAVAIRKLIDRPPAAKPHGIVALGCILQGATSHAALLSADVSRALMAMQVESGIPIAWGILTPETLEQALDRSGMKQGNKGREAALAVIEAANLAERL